jgi:hypothetical protein
MERPFMGASIQAGCIEVNVWPRNAWPLMTFSGWIPGGNTMSDIVYLVGLIVIVMAILSFIGLR